MRWRCRRLRRLSIDAARLGATPGCAQSLRDVFFRLLRCIEQQRIRQQILVSQILARLLRRQEQVRGLRPENQRGNGRIRPLQSFERQAIQWQVFQRQLIERRQRRARPSRATRTRRGTSARRSALRRRRLSWRNGHLRSRVAQGLEGFERHTRRSFHNPGSSIGCAARDGGVRAYRATSPGGTVGSASQIGRPEEAKQPPKRDARLTSGPDERRTRIPTAPVS